MRSTVAKIVGISLGAALMLTANPAFARHHHHHRHHRPHHPHAPKQTTPPVAPQPVTGCADHCKP